LTDGNVQSQPIDHGSELRDLGAADHCDAARQPARRAFAGRGYYDVKELDVLTEGPGVLSDAQTYLDILDAEFPVALVQGDRIDIPFHQGAQGGSFEISDRTPFDAKGMSTLTLRKLVP
jgi:hypothetical protein